MSQHQAIVVAAGSGPSTVRGLPAPALVIAADGGLERCRELGLDADIVIGDFDSVDAEALDAAVRAGAEIIRHPPRKDATDLELALDAALTRGATQVTVVASAEGRLDHLLSSLLLLGAATYAAVELDALVGDGLVHVVRGTRVLTGAPGELVSLMAVGGSARGVTTEGLEYPLVDETLEPGSSRGVSNTFLALEALVTVTDGVLLAIRAGAAE